MVSEGFLIDPPECFPFFLHGILWDFPNNQATEGGSFLISLRLLVITPLLDSLRRYLKEQWFSLWCQIRIYLYSHIKSSSVENILDMYSLIRLAPITSFSTSSKLVGIWNGLSVGVRRSYPASRISSWPKIRILQVSPQGASLLRSYRVTNIGEYEPFWYLLMSFGDSFPMEPPPRGRGRF